MELALVLDAGERFGGRFVVGGLEDAAEQDRHIVEFCAGPFLDRRDRLMAQKGVRAAEIEHELRIGAQDAASQAGYLYDPYHSTSLGRDDQAINYPA